MPTRPRAAAVSTRPRATRRPRSTRPRKVAPAAAAEGVASGDAPQRELGGHRLRMCPAGCAGPLLNEHCSDMRAHHGQCPSCGQRSHTDAAIAERSARAPAGGAAAGEEGIGARLPTCPHCEHHPRVLFNGCLECGYPFADTDWERMPLWDEQAKGRLERFATPPPRGAPPGRAGAARGGALGPRARGAQSGHRLGGRWWGGGGG